MSHSRTDGGDSPTRRAKLFWNGRSQAVRLPKEFRFDGDEVSIRREGELVILEPTGKTRLPEGYWQAIDALREGLDFPDIEALGGSLLDITLDEE